MTNQVPTEFQWWDTVTRWRPILPDNLVPLLFNERDLAENERKRCEELYDKAEAHFEREEYDDAINNLVELLKIDQVDIDSWLLLGYSYLEIDRIREAWRSYKYAWYFDRWDPELLQAMSNILIEIEDFQLARYFIWDWLFVEEDENNKKDAMELFQIYCNKLKFSLAEEKRLIDKYHNWLDSIDDEEIELFECTIAELNKKLEQIDNSPVNPQNPKFPLKMEMDVKAPNNDISSIIEKQNQRTVYDIEVPLYSLTVDLDYESLKCQCQSCSFPLPWDMPYCLNCGLPNIYLDIAEENEYNS